MGRMKRYSNELALESKNSPHDASYQWLAVRKTSVRSGSVNHERDADAHSLHKLVLESAPYYLDLSPLDIDHLEVLFGFDLLAPGNHDAIVFNALLAGSPLASLCDRLGTTPIDCQPIFGVALGDDGDTYAHFEIKTRTGGISTGGGFGGSTGTSRGSARPRPSGSFSTSEDPAEYPLSLYLIVRKYGPCADIRDLPSTYNSLIARGEELIERRIIPNLLVPIREAITPL